MDENNVSSVNAEPVANVEPQNTEVQGTGESTTNNVVSESANQKPVQTPEENARFAEQRRARESAEQKAAKLEKDYSIARQYGAEYGVYSEDDIIQNYGHLGIDSLESFEEAVKREKMKERGIDPDLLESEINNHPLVKEAQKSQKEVENYAEFEEFYTANVGPMPKDLRTLPAPVLEAFKKGESMTNAFMKYDYQHFKEQQKAKELNEKNASSSPGSLTGNGSSKGDFISYETFEANKGNQRWIIDNLTKINKSRSKW